MTTGVVLLIVALFVSIMLHEAGHLLTAKKFGMKASQYFLGFGPTLWSFRRGETEYGVKAIPAGGFVKIVGMTPLEEIDPADEPRAFYRQPARQRAVVLAAGSTMHFVLAAVLLLVVFMGIGLPALATSATIGSVSACVPSTASGPCRPGDPVAPAKAAGLRPGDRVLSIDGRSVDGWDEFSQALRRHGAGPVTLVVDRDGQRLTLRPTLVAAERPLPNGGKATVGVLGVTPSVQTERLGPVAAVKETGQWFVSSVGLTFKALGAIPAAVPQLLDPNATRDPASSPASVVGVARVSGQAFATEQDLAQRLGAFLVLVAGLNLFVGIFNLLPLLPLDGGHLAVLGFESARSGIARVLRRPDPGPVDLAKLIPLAYLVVMLFIGLTVLLVYADIVNPIANPFG